MAAKGIKGITIQIGGDTTDLDKKLTEVGKGSREIQTELREVNKLLKLDPSNTELLAQKQELLKKSIQGTSEKLETLKEAERQVQEQFANGEVSEQQYRALQREIIATEQNLNELEAAAREVAGAAGRIESEEIGRLGADAGAAAEEVRELGDSASQADEDLDKTNKRAEEFKSKVGTMATAAGAAVAAIGAAAVAAGTYALQFDTDFDKALNSVITQTGATSSELNGLETSLENIYKNNFGEDIEDVANAMAMVKQQTGLSNEELEKTTETAILMRDTFDMDVNESVRGVTAMMKQFGVDAETAYNLIAQGAQKGLNQNQDLSDQVAEYSVYWGDLGFTAEEMFNSIANGAKDGSFQIDYLNDAVKEFGIRVKDGTADEVFTNLGLNADELKQKFVAGGESAKEAFGTVNNALVSVEDQVQLNQMGVALYGTKWEDLGVDAVKALMNTNGEISTTKDALTDINNQKYDDLGSQFQELGRNIQTDLVKPLGEELAPTAKDVLGMIKDNIPQIKGVLSDVIEKIKEFITFIVANGSTIISLIGGIAAGMLAWNVVTMVQGLVESIKKWKDATEGVTVVQKILNSTLLKNPVAIIATAIVALIATLVLLYNNCEWFREMVNGIFEKIKELVAVAVEKVGAFISTIWTKIQEIGALIQPYLLMLWENIKIIWNEVAPYFQVIWLAIQQIFSVVATVLGGFFGAAWTCIKAIWDVVSAYFQMLWNTVAGIFAVVQAVLSGDFQGAWDAIKGIFAGFADFFHVAWEAVKTIFSAVGSFFGDIFKAAWEAVKNVFGEWGSFFAGLWDSICNTFRNLGTSIGEAIGGAVRYAINGVIGWIESTINNGISLINGAIGLINKIPGVSIGTMGYLNLPMLAKGGVLEEGQAIVAEAGAELLQMVNGKAIVTPLTNSAKNRNVNNLMGKGQTTNDITLKIENFYNNRKQDVRELTEEILEIAEEIKEREVKAYG